MSRVHRRQTAQKRRKKMGSSVAYKTIGTFLSQNIRHEDACGGATEMQSSGCAAVRQWPTLSSMPPSPSPGGGGCSREWAHTHTHTRSKRGSGGGEGVPREGGTPSPCS